METMTDLPSLEQVHSVLLQFLTPNTKLVNEATIWLRNYLQIPQSVPVMFHILQHGNNPVTRQAAGVVLRSWIAKHWGKVDHEVARNMKQNLLETIAGEPMPLLRRAMSELIITIARFTLPMDQWQEFWPAMFHLANSLQPVNLQIVLGIIEELGEKIFELLCPMIDDFLHLFQVCLEQNQDPNVRVAALKAAGVCISQLDNFDPLIPKFKSIIPQMLSVVKFCIEQEANDEAIDVITVFQSFVDICPNVIQEQLMDLTQYFLSVGRNTNIDLEVRQGVLQFVQWVLQFNTSFVTKSGLLEPIIVVGFEIAAQPEEMDQYAHWETTPNTLALQLLSCVASYIKPKLVFKISMDYVNNGMQSQNPWERRAAVGLLSSIVFGCCEQMSQDVASFVPYLQAAFNDQDQYVRRAACTLLGQFSEYLIPEISDYAETLLPMAFQAMSEDNEEIQDRAIYSVISFVDNMESDDISPYLDHIMNQLAQLFSYSKSNATKELIVEAIGAVASVAANKFIPYWQPCIKMLQPLMDSADPLSLSLRGHSLDCVGIIALTVSSELFQPYYQYFMEKAIEGLQLPNIDGTDLREYTINFVANIAESLKADFIPYLPACLDIILKALSNKDGSKPELNEDQIPMARLLRDDSEDDLEKDMVNGGGNHSENEDSWLEDWGIQYVMNDSFAEEKACALQALGTLANSLGHLWVPYIDQCMPLLMSLSKYIQPKIRIQSIYPMESFAVCISQAHPPSNIWSPGLPPDQCPLSDETMKYVNSFIGELLLRIKEDFDLVAAGRCVQSLQFLLENLGAPAIHGQINNIVSVIGHVLGVETRSQITEVVGDEQNEETRQDMYALFDSACDFVVALSAAYRGQIGYWFSLIEGIMEQYEANCSELEDDEFGSWRQTAIGSLAEVLENIGIELLSKDQFEMFLVQGMQAVEDPHLTTTSNSVYLLRLCVSHPECFQFYPKILDLVVPKLRSTEAQLHDNSLGCIGNMIINASHLVPLQQVLPEFLNAFPILFDKNESGCAYGAIIHLLEHGNEIILPLVPQTFKILVSDIGSGVVPDRVRSRAKDAIVYLWGQFRTLLEPVANQFNEDQTNHLHLCLQ